MNLSQEQDLGQGLTFHHDTFRFPAKLIKKEKDVTLRLNDIKEIVIESYTFRRFEKQPCAIIFKDVYNTTIKLTCHPLDYFSQKDVILNRLITLFDQKGIKYTIRLSQWEITTIVIVFMLAAIGLYFIISGK